MILLMSTQPVVHPSASPVVYPTITAGGRQYQLRFAHGAWYQLQTWGFTLGDPQRPIPILALAAAAAGETDASGKWKSAGFARPLDLADAMLPEEPLSSLDAPVLEALQKAAPRADLKLDRTPGADQPN
jgi:hypothetical protein